HQAHLERRLRVVLLAEVPDLARLLLPDDAGQEPGSVATVEAADARARLADPCVLRRDGEVANDVQHVAAADRVARDHRDHRLWKPAGLHLEGEDAEAARAVPIAVAAL